MKPPVMAPFLLPTQKMPHRVTESPAQLEKCRCLPLVIVEGFLGRTGSMIWGDFQRYLNQGCHQCQRRVIFASVGPVSSLHDRACELYYAIIGGTVDYGEGHSILHGHSRHGRTHAQGLYPNWSSENPLHFLGHSIGGATIVKLQYLMKQGHFGPHAHPDWILSVNTLSTPFRGTQAVYILGERIDAAPFVRQFSVGAFLAKAVHILSYLHPILPRAIDFHAESRHLSLYDISLLSLFQQLWKSQWAESRDAAPFDVTFQAADEREARGEGEPYPETFYRSCSAYMTQKCEGGGGRSIHCIPFQVSTMFSPFYFMARAVGDFKFSKIQPLPSFLSEGKTSDNDLAEEYRSNDGVVPLISQWHPFSVCCPNLCLHSDSKEHIGPGIWVVQQLNRTSHLSLMPLWRASSRQQEYWLTLGQWLRGIENM